MGKLLFIILKVFKSIRQLRLKISGKTEADIHTQRIVSGKAWEEFCENLKTAGAALVYPGAPRDAFSQAEGVRYLSRLTRAALEAYVEYSDTAFPSFCRMVHETVKLGADNPDNYYMNAQISGAFEYRIVGKRNTINYIGFFTQNGNYGTTGGMAPCGVLEGKNIIVEDNGSFEIILSRSRKGKNWLKIEDDTSLVMVRQTFMDRKSEMPAELRIENLNGKVSPDPLTPDKIDNGLRTAALFVAGAPILFAKWAKGFKKHANELPVFNPKTSNAAGGDANIIYHHSYWSLANDEALLIEFTPPECENWNFQLNNYWMESLDYRYFPVCINRSSALTKKDGRIRIVVSETNPGVENWLSTCGHSEGTMCLRWYRPKKRTNLVRPVCRVIKQTEIAKDVAG
jgi:hypothetical protein